MGQQLMKQDFTLVPFAPADFKITGSVARNSDQLTLHYVLIDDRSEIAITPTNHPTRKHDLWQATCFELFLSIPDSTRYWEFNLAPSGDWNVYRFSDYRSKMQEEIAFTALPFQFEPETKSLYISIDLSAIVQSSQALNIGITAVLKHHNSDITYWALTHSGTEADFHRKDSFIIQL